MGDASAHPKRSKKKQRRWRLLATYPTHQKRGSLHAVEMESSVASPLLLEILGDGGLRVFVDRGRERSLFFLEQLRVRLLELRRHVGLQLLGRRFLDLDGGQLLLVQRLDVGLLGSVLVL